MSVCAATAIQPKFKNRAALTNLLTTLLYMRLHDKI